MKASAQWIRQLVPQLDDSIGPIVDALERIGWEVQTTEALDGTLSPLGLDNELVDEPAHEVASPAFDTIIDILDTQRADVLGHAGIAREVAAACRLPFELPAIDAPIRVAEGTIHSRLDVDVRNATRCPHFGAIVVEDVAVHPSPLWLRVRLHALGLVARNNIEDIANLVMLEFGHPVAVYDLDAINGSLEVRLASNGEEMSVQETNLALTPLDLVVADDSGPIGLAGIVDGQKASVGPSTRRVVYASAWYEAGGILASAHAHGFHTESSRRYERGVDPNDTAETLAQVGALATRLANGAAVPGAIHVFEHPWHARQIEVRCRTVEQRIHGGHSDDRQGSGATPSLQQTMEMLARLGFEAVPLHADASGEGLHVSVPSYRHDVQIEADVVGELDRLHTAWSRSHLG